MASSPAQAGRVINGTAVAASDVSANGRWSAVVGLLVQNGTGSRLCTGTLITPTWVVTAAHCVAEQANAQAPVHPSRVTVLAGTVIADGSGEVLRAHSVHVHPGFSWSTASWDAGLVELAEASTHAPFALPDGARAGSYSIGTTDNIAGFGRAVARDPNSTGMLRSGRMEPVAADDCEAANPGSGAYADCNVPGRTSQATCYGDSGGPIVRFDPARGGTPVLWGITSTGPDPCDAGTSTFAPGYQTRVLAVASWIGSRISASTYAPAGRRADAKTNAVRGDEVAIGGGATATVRTVGGGVGIGVYRIKVGRKPTARRTGTIAVTASLVGTDGFGRAELQRSVGKKWRTVARRALDFPTAGTIDKATLKAPRCGRKSKGKYQVRLRVFDAQGGQRDVLTERVKICR